MEEFTWNPDYVYEVLPRFKTHVNEFEDGSEERAQVWTEAKRSWNLEFKNRTETEKDAILDFFLARKGRLEAFTWTCKLDSTQYTVRFDNDELNAQAVGNKRYSISCKFVTCNE